MAAGVLLAAAIGFAVVACGSPGLTIINRTAVPISPAPDYIVAPCTSVWFSEGDLERMSALTTHWAMGLIVDRPAAGVARMDTLYSVPGRPYYLITSIREPELLADPPQPADLPVCEGQPRGDFTIGQ